MPATPQGTEGLAKQDLLSRAQRCATNGWTWIHENLTLFAPADPFNPSELQKLAELALLYGCATSWSGERARTTLKQIEQFIVSFLDDPVIAQHARKRLAYFNPYFVAYLLLRPLGYRFDAYEEGLSAARLAGYPDALEATPYRELEIFHLTWKAGLRKQRPLCDNVYYGTALARCRNPIQLDMMSVYSVTHTLFYINDFCGPAEVMTVTEMRRAADIVESLLVHYWRKQDWDLVGELALNLVSLDQDDTRLFSRGVGALLEAWGSQPDGALPGRSFKADGTESGRDYRFEHCYHTTLVGTLFCEAYIYRHRADAGERS